MKLPSLSISLLVLIIISVFIGCNNDKKDKVLDNSIVVEDTIKVKMITSYGPIILALSNKTPQHRDNFSKLVKEGVYDSLLFHRVI